MQKKKPYFQVIPNCSINGVTNWNESKEVPAEHRCDEIGLRDFSTTAGSICTVKSPPLIHRGDIVI
jgi:hypothetical protein